ncbi:MAG: type I pullulanase [Clostridiales bacterium]|nr:type I pullulanase [Clostridiales bacterium]
MRKSNSVKITEAFRKIGIAVIIAVLALISIPFWGLIGSSAKPVAKAEEETMVSPPRNAARTVEVTINYFRPNADYANWNLWIWPNGGDGKAYQFTSETTATKTGSKVWKSATANIEGVSDSGKEAIGFIVRLGEWQEKDISSDRFILSEKIVDNKVTIWVVSADSEFYYNEADIMFGAKITTAKFTSFDNVFIKTGAPVTGTSVFVVRDETDDIVGMMYGSDTAVLNKTSFNIPLQKSIKISKTYTVYDEPTVEFDPDKHFLKHAVNISDLYGLKTFTDAYNYDGALGAEYSETSTTFRVWSPAATSMAVKIYTTGDEEETVTAQPMNVSDKGVWTLTVSGNLDGKYYTYEINGEKEVVDPYATSAGRNGVRGMIIKPGSADPEGWATHKRPEKRNSYSDAIIYEAHLRDLTINENSNVPANKRGKYLGLTVKSEDVGGKLTPLSYLKDLGITEIHFQPLFDFASVQENFNEATYIATGENTQFNWGYDPLNYNAPEGSYSSNPADGKTRVNEMKQMIMALHEAGIRVIMDVVYNHVSSAPASNFQALMPYYYFRTDSNGEFTNGSGCGNETASERYMYHKFMIDSVVHWASEYKIDGFRFDLMGLHDVETMNDIYDELQKLDPDHDVMVYGEPWDAGSNALPDYKLAANMANARKMPNIAIFNDITRDGLKGSVWSSTDTGFVSGLASSDNAIYIGAAGATNLKGVNYAQFDKTPFAVSPIQNINYASAHDNETLWDRLNGSVKADADALKAMNRLSAAAVLTSQGPAFFLAGEEMLRSKKISAQDNSTYGYDGNIAYYLTDKTYYYSRNSYKSPDSVNAIDWSLVDANKDMVEFYKGLIAIRKALPEFRLSNKGDVSNGVTIRDYNMSDGVTSYIVKDPASDNYSVVLFNNNTDSRRVFVPDATYKVYLDGSKASAEGLKNFSGNTYTVGARSAVVMRAELDAAAVAAWAATENPDEGTANLGLALGLGIGLPVVALIAGGVVFFLSRKKNGEAVTEPASGAQPAGDKPEESDESAATVEEPANEPEPEEAPSPAEEPAPVEEAAPEEEAVEEAPAEEPAPTEEKEEPKAKPAAPKKSAPKKSTKSSNGKGKKKQ